MKQEKTTTKSADKDNVENYLKHLPSINKNLGAMVSYKQSLIRGLITGVGTAIGATIIFGILLALLGTFLARAEDIPILRDLINQLELRQLLNGSDN